MLFKCLELVEFADEWDLQTLLGDDADESRMAASGLERAAHAKLLEFEGITFDSNAELKRPKTTYITGMATRIFTYKKRCWEAKGKREYHHKNTPLEELEIVREFEREERSEQKSTLPGLNNAMSYFGGDKK